MQNSEIEDDPTVAGDDSPNDTQTYLFSGDKGELPLEARRLLVLLLLGPSVDARRQTRLWPVLLTHEPVLRSRLHDLFLDLVVDHEQQVAFTRQVVADDLDAPILLRKANLSFLETALLLFLRARLTHADAQGERAVVSLQEMHDHLQVFERTGNTDRAKFDKQMTTAVEKAKKLNLVRALAGGDKRFEVAPTLKLLFTADEIQALSRTYSNLAQGGEGIAGSDGASDADTDNDFQDEEIQ